MKTLFYRIKEYHHIMKMAAKSALKSCSDRQANLFALTIEVIIIFLFLSALPLWIFLFKILVVFTILAVLFEFLLRIRYWKKDKMTNHLNKGVITGFNIVSPRLDSRCSDAQGQLKEIHISERQANHMAKAILGSAHSFPIKTVRIGKFRLWAMFRFIREITS